MRIQSDDKECWLELSRDGDARYADYFTMSLGANITVPPFSGGFSGILWPSPAGFLAELDAFMAGRADEAILAGGGNESCTLRFFRWDGAGHIAIEAMVAHGYGPGTVTRAALTCKFKIDTEYMNDIRSEFHRLFTS